VQFVEVEHAVEEGDEYILVFLGAEDSLKAKSVLGSANVGRGMGAVTAIVNSRRENTSFVLAGISVDEIRAQILAGS
jgi:hypothetical protein